jgi:hypothetical protein
MLIFLSSLGTRLNFSMLANDRIDVVERCVEHLPRFGASEHNFARDKDEQHDFGRVHAIDESRKEFGFVGRVILVRGAERFEANRKADIGRRHHVLNDKRLKLDRKIELLHNARVLASSQLAQILALGARHNHLARRKYQSRRLGLSNPHDHCRKTLGVVLGIARTQRYLFQIQRAIQRHCCHHILNHRHYADASCQSWHHYC